MTFSTNDFGPQDRTQLTGGTAGGAKAAEFEPGQIIGNDYQVLAWIGAGGMGNVYRVQHTIMQSQYALKTLSTERITETAWQRFQNEAKAIGRMNHPNIVAIYNLGLHENQPFYVMDLLRGQTLQDLIKTKGALEVEEALKIFVEVCAGLSYAHKKGIVHRDIKPPNIYIVEEAGASGARVKIVDFGIAKLTGLKDETIQRLTNVGEVCGTPYYMSPEQCEAGKIDPRSDVYSLGCTLFETLTGQPPFRGRNAMDTMHMHMNNTPPSLSSASGGKSFPPELERAVATMIAKAPMDRYQTVEAIGQELSTILEGKPPAKVQKSGQSRSQSARRPAVSRSQLRETSLEETPGLKLKLKPMILIALALIVCSAGSILLLDQLRNSRQAQTSGSQPEDKGPAKRSRELPVFVVDGPFAREVTDARGKKQIEFDFPPKKNLGLILIDSPVAGDSTKSFACQDKQTIETGHKLYFLPNEACIYNPTAFAGFGPNFVSSITFPIVKEPDRDNQFEKHIKDSLVEISHLKAVERLDLLNCPELNDQMLPVLDQMPDLVNLSILANNVTIKTLASQPVLGRLDNFTFSNTASELIGSGHQLHQMHRNIESAAGELFEDDGEHHHHFWRHHEEGSSHTNGQSISPLLESLAKSDKLISLELPGVGLSAQDIKMIGQMKKLEVLDLSSSNLISSDIEKFSDLPNLKAFTADNCLIGAEALPAFKKLATRSLKIIQIKSLSMTPELLARFRKELPNVMVANQ